MNTLNKILSLLIVFVILSIITSVPLFATYVALTQATWVWFIAVPLWITIWIATYHIINSMKYTIEFWD